MVPREPTGSSAEIPTHQEVFMTVTFERLDGSFAMVTNPAGVAGVVDSGANPGCSIIRWLGGGTGTLVKGSARDVLTKLGLPLGDNAAPDFPDDEIYTPMIGHSPTHSSGEE